MLFLSGKLLPGLGSGLGAMVTPESYRAAAMPEGLPWAADTGCFAAPERFDAEEYLDWLGQMVARHGPPLFATAPDRFGDGDATLRAALPLLGRLRSAGVPAALVAQPGMAWVPWGEFDALFVGGPNPWQRSEACHEILVEAQGRGLWTHKGRVNTKTRLRAAYGAGFDSADGTLLAFGPDINLPRLRRWLGALDGQMTLH